MSNPRAGKLAHDMGILTKERAAAMAAAADAEARVREHKAAEHVLGGVLRDLSEKAHYFRGKSKPAIDATGAIVPDQYAATLNEIQVMADERAGQLSEHTAARAQAEVDLQSAERTLIAVNGALSGQPFTVQGD